MNKTGKAALCILAAMIFVSLSCKKEKNDTTAPSITILGANPYEAGQGTIYTDPGATAYDETDGDITPSIVTTNNVTTTDTGYYQVKYNVIDKAGNAATEEIRTVHVIYM